VDNLTSILGTFSLLETTAAILAIGYLILAIRQNILCWLVQLISSFLYIVIFFQARLYMESALYFFYAAIAVYGWFQWTSGGPHRERLQISIWTPTRHGIVLTLILVFTVLFGMILRRTDAVFPFLDSFTTIAAVVATYMVANKILENWVYWFVIDSISVYLYQARELHVTSLLFVLYLVLIFIGFRRWWFDWRGQDAPIGR